MRLYGCHRNAIAATRSLKRTLSYDGTPTRWIYRPGSVTVCPSGAALTPCPRP